MSTIQNQYTPPQAPPTSALAIAGLILAFFISPVGLILSILGIVDTKPEKHKSGRGLAIAGLIISVIGCAILALILSLTVFAASSTVSAVNEVSKGIEADQSAAETDVSVTSCGEGTLGQTAVLSITNSSDAPKTYTVTVSANDAGGTRLGELNAFSNSIAPGQTATVEASGTVPDSTQVFECVVANVNRF